MTTHRVLTVVGLVAALALTACGSTGVGVGGPASPTPLATPSSTPSTTPQAEGPHAAALAALDLARDDWAAQGLDSYTYELTRQCFCPPEATGPWTVTVEDDTVTAVTDAEGTDVATTGGFFEFGTIEDLHDMIAGMLEGADATTPSGSYDVQGLPQALYVDPEPMMADEEATFTAQIVTPGDTRPGQPDPASGSMLEPLSESALWATGTGVDPTDAFSATPICGPTDALLGYDLTGTFATAEPLADAAARLQALGLDVIEEEGAVTATGTTSTGAPVTLTLDGATATVRLELEAIPGGYDIPIERPCG